MHLPTPKPALILETPAKRARLEFATCQSELRATTPSLENDVSATAPEGSKVLHTALRNFLSQDVDSHSLKANIALNTLLTQSSSFKQ